MTTSRRRKAVYGLLGVVGLGLVGGGVAYAAVDVPVAKASARQQASVLQYADGSELARVGSRDRELVPLREVSVDAQRAVLAAEQRGYWSEPGVSPTAVLRAAWANVRGGGVRQGGSTITQQYVKNAYLSDERTFTRKAKEAVVALKLSQTRSKEQVLEDYLNTVYFGRGAYGIEVAAKTWFGKRAKDLDGAEGAVLAALLKSPSGYDPARNPEDARERWEYVLDGMVAEGWLTREDRAAARYPAVREDARSTADDRSGPRGYVVEMVEAELARLGFREGSLQSGGLVVRTTLRKDAQAAAVGAVQDVVPTPEREDQAAVQGALVAVRPGSGEVLAYYGGRTGDGGFDYASQGRQDAGSTMKAYVLAAALEKGIGLGTRLDGDSPQTLPGYSKPVRNFGDTDHGEVDLVDATAKSVNTAYVALAGKVGPQAVADVAHRAGVRQTDRLGEPEGPPSLGIALGVYGVRVVDQANAFATFAAGGVRAAPHAVLSVTAPGGTTVYRAERVTERVLAEDVTADVTHALQQVVERGTASGKGRLDGRPAIGKTGTTQGSRDAWMVGATPQLAAAVWVGRGDDEPMTGVLGSSGGVTGGGAPARIWKAFLDAALEGDPVQRFPEKAGVGAPATPSPTATPSASPSSSPSPTPTATAPEQLVLPTPGPEESAQPVAVEQPAQQPAPPADAQPQPYEEPYQEPYEEPAPPAPEEGGYAPPPGDGSVDEDTAPTSRPRGRDKAR